MAVNEGLHKRAVGCVAVVASYIFPITLKLASGTSEITPLGGVGEVLQTLLMNIVSNPIKSLVEANYIGIPNDIAMQVVGVGFIGGVIQDSCETAINSSTDVLYTALAEFMDRRKRGESISWNRKNKI